jgi:acetolactate decarboxylase
MTCLGSGLASALHVQRMTRDEFDHDPVARHLVWQTSSIDALLDGAYEGDLTVGELAAHGDLGIGTVQHLDGEMVLVDGEFFTVKADGSVLREAPDTRTPFAVVCRFSPDPPVELDGPMDIDALTAAIDAVAGTDAPVVAVRVDGLLRDVHVRSVPRQHPPYPPLAEVTAHQVEWTIPEVRGSVIGFRFPDYAQGIDVAGYHLHVISDDRLVGGHLLGLTVAEATLRVDRSSDLHLEVPEGVRVGAADLSEAKRAAIRAVEGG